MRTYLNSSLHKICPDIPQCPKPLAYVGDFVLELKEIIKKFNYRFFLCLNVPSIKITLLGKVLSDFHQVHALLTTIDFVDERLQVTSTEHCDGDGLSTESEMTRAGCVQ